MQSWLASAGGLQEEGKSPLRTGMRAVGEKFRTDWEKKKKHEKGREDVSASCADFCGVNATKMGQLQAANMPPALLRRVALPAKAMYVKCRGPCPPLLSRAQASPHGLCCSLETV